MRRDLGLSRVVSGGQTGVDQAALQAAIELGLAHGGWCPAGRRAENGAIPARFQLKETSSSSYPARTEQNVLDSDATLLLYRRELTGGSKLTAQLARRHGRPLLSIDLEPMESRDSQETCVGGPLGQQEVAAVFSDFFTWLAANDVRVLNVAGPRESSHPGIGESAYAFLLAAAALGPA